jgi:hypothetical protein
LKHPSRLALQGKKKSLVPFVNNVSRMHIAQFQQVCRFKAKSNTARFRFAIITPGKRWDIEALRPTRGNNTDCRDHRPGERA